MAESKVELILTADNKQAVAGIKEVQKATEDLHKTVVEGTKREKGLIEDIKDSLRDLEKGKERAWKTEDIEKYSQKIQEAKQDLKEYENLGVKAEKTTATLSQTITKWALGLGGAAVALKIVKDALLATTAGINAFNIAGVAAKQVLHNLVTGAASLTSGLMEVIKAQKELNELRLQEVIDTHKAKIAQKEYNRLYFEASDRKKTDKERIELLNKAMVAHNKMIDIETQSTIDQRDAVEKLAKAAPGNEKLLLRWAALEDKLVDLESARFSGMKRLESMKTSLEEKTLNDRAALWDRYMDEIDRTNDIADKKEVDRIRDKYQLYKEYYDWYRDKVDSTIKDEQKIKEASWKFEMDIARKLFKLNQNLAKEQWDELQKSLGEDGDGKGTIWSLLGLDPESEEGQKVIDNMEVFADNIKGILTSITDRMVEDAQRRRELLDQQITETQNALELEAGLMEEGYANNLAAKRKELEQLKKQRAEALADEEKAFKIQRQIDTAMQVSSLVTATAEILKGWAKIPLIGHILAIAAIAAMFTAFGVAKVKAASLTKLAEGGTGTDTGIITGKSHAAGGEHFLSHVEVERGERWGVLNKKASEKFGKTFDHIVSSFNKDQMPIFGTPDYSSNVTVNNDGSNSRLDKVIAEQKKLNSQFGKDQILITGHRKVVTKGKNIRLVG